MSANARIKPNMLPSGAEGLPVAMHDVETGTLSANVCTELADAKAIWQVSDDGKGWINAKPANNASHVALQPAEPVCIEAPSCVYGKRYARVLVTASTAAVSYNYRVSPI